MKNFPEPLSLDNVTKIVKEIQNNLCSIYIRKEIISFGFFCKIPFPDFEHTLKVLITNCENINDELLEKEKELDLLIKGGEIVKYTNEDYNISIIEINEDKDDIHDYFELDEIMWNQETNKLINESLYTLQNSNNNIYICLGFLTEINNDDNDNNFIYISRLKNNNLNSPILNFTSHKLLGINIKNNEKSYSNIGLFIYYPLKEFIDKTYYKRMSVKEFASKYNLELKNKKIEKMDLNNYNLGDEGLSRICEVSYKELNELKELNLKGNNITDINPLQNLKLEKLEILNLSENKIIDINVL